jgi:hypothetical protein
LVVYQRADKEGKRIERCLISTFQVAESMASKVIFANGSTYRELAIECRRAGFNSTEEGG